MRTRTRSGRSCAEVLRVVGEPTRLELLGLLGRGERSVSELGAALGQELHFVSRHLGVLHAAGLVARRRDGQRVRYRLAPELLGPEPGGIDLGCCELRLRDDDQGGARAR
ncbi:MAG: metalloregulator ArsR/SmtB family transcription factor [Planctomycetes bacterium]|nr:metalloregulator ArsR/SmtB family transcription factor [Planctomycetota bacterium]